MKIIHSISYNIYIYILHILYLIIFVQCLHWICSVLFKVLAMRGMFDVRHWSRSDHFWWPHTLMHAHNVATINLHPLLQLWQGVDGRCEKQLRAESKKGNCCSQTLLRLWRLVVLAQTSRVDERTQSFPTEVEKVCAWRLFSWSSRPWRLWT